MGVDLPNLVENWLGDGSGSGVSGKLFNFVEVTRAAPVPARQRSPTKVVL
jgi:hypothetical protein